MKIEGAISERKLLNDLEMPLPNNGEVKPVDEVVNEARKDQVDLSGKYKFTEINGKREIVFNFGK